MNHKQKNAFLWACIAVVVALKCIAHFAFPVSADIEPLSVELSLEQTFALYGSEFDALGYTSSNGVGRIKFYYVGTSDELLSLQHNVPFRNYYATSTATDGYVTSYNQQKFLIYACDASLVDDLSHLFTVQIPFSLDISNIQFYRQRFWWSAQKSAYVYSSSLTSRRSKIELYNSYSQAAYSQSTPSYGACKLPNNSTSLEGFPLLETDLTFGGSRTMVGTCIDLYYMPFDENNAHVNFNVSGMNLYLKDIARYSTPSTISDWFGADYQGENTLLNLLLNKNCFFLYIAPPIVSDGFVLPEPEIPDNPDYSEQIDNINTNTANISANLAAILAKLDLIYQNMNVSITGTVNISSSSVSAIGSAVQGLFVPTQADILNFRLGMNTLVSDTFAPFADAQTIRDTVASRIMGVSSVSTLDLPLMDLRSAGVDFYLPASTFTDNGFDVVDNKVKVPLKPRQDEWGFFYELLAWSIDIVCTIAFINMLLNKFHGLVVGKKVVELENDC